MTKYVPNRMAFEWVEFTLLNFNKIVSNWWEVNLGDLRKLEGEYHFSDFDITLFYVSLLYHESYVGCRKPQFAPISKAKTKIDGKQRGHREYWKRS